MPEYTFHFDPAASGLDYSVTNRAGIEVDDGTLESDADSVELTVDLPWGDYVGTASTASGDYVITRTHSANGSIAAGGEGILDPGTTYIFEINDGADLSPNSGFVSAPFDTLDGEPYNDEVPLPPGLYVGRLEIDFVQPADDRVVSVRISSPGTGDGNSIRQGPFPISSVATNATGYTLYASGPIVVGDNGAIGMVIATATVTAEADPADLVISYAEFDLTPVLG